MQYCAEVSDAQPTCWTATCAGLETDTPSLIKTPPESNQIIHFRIRDQLIILWEFLFVAPPIISEICHLFNLVIGTSFMSKMCSLQTNKKWSHPKLAALASDLPLNLLIRWWSTFPSNYLWIYLAFLLDLIPNLGTSLWWSRTRWRGKKTTKKQQNKNKNKTKQKNFCTVLFMYICTYNFYIYSRIMSKRVNKWKHTSGMLLRILFS